MSLPDWRISIADAREAALRTLGSPEMKSIARGISAAGLAKLADPEHCYSLVEGLTADPASAATLRRLKESVPAEPPLFERWMLLQAAIAGLARADQIPVFDAVKAMWAEEVLWFAEPPQSTVPMFTLGHVRFHEMARIVTWRRFPAGQFHWEPGGLPRSTLWHAPAAEVPRLLWCWLSELRGRGPFFEYHVNARRKNRLTLTEAEGIKSFYLMARSLELQPRVLGLTSFAWFHSPDTAEVSPQLAWLREFPAKHGALAISSIGAAPPDAGFLIGSEERRRKYEKGRYRPSIGVIVWPRRALLEWARQQSPL